MGVNVAGKPYPMIKVLISVGVCMVIDRMTDVEADENLLLIVWM